MTREETVEALLNQSGNSFHCRVARYFADKDWHIQLSPYYMDSSMNKAREIDLVAEKAWLIRDGYHSNPGTLNVKLFIECKYIPQVNLFWFDDKDAGSAKQWLYQNSSFRQGNNLVNEHHYLSTNPQVAKLFASENKPAVENEVIYKAINQSLNSMVYLRNRESIISPAQAPNPNVFETLEMPVIVCNSFENFYFTNVIGEDEPARLTENFQLEVNYAYVDQDQNSKNEYFLIDVIEFDQLNNFSGLIETGKNALAELVADE